MKIGKMRERIIIEEKIKSDGPWGDEGKYEVYAAVWAEVRFLKGVTLYAARAANIKTEMEFVIRYIGGLKETMLINYEGKKYIIEGILPLDNKKTHIVIKAHSSLVN